MIKFTGSMVAIVTPMQSNGAIDYVAYSNLIKWHIAAGTSAIIVAGTTGESPTLSHSEKLKLISIALDESKGAISIIAGTGSNCTRTTIKFSHEVKALGVDGLLIVTPYYNKPTQKGLFAHFQAVALAVEMPIILYNVPGRTGCDLSPTTVAALANQVPYICGVKEATGDVSRVALIKKSCPANFGLYSGDDATALDFMIAGGQGVISVTANVAPHLMQQMCAAALNGDIPAAEAFNQKLQLLHQHLFIESNPIPTKWLLHKMDMIQDGIRLPLTTLDTQFHALLTNALHATQLEQPIIQSS